MRLKQKGPEDHPLHWSDTELAYMVQVSLKHPGVNPTVMYHLMGYDGKRPTPGFMRRVERLKVDKS